MVQLAPSRLTKLGFRRDVKLFLAALLGFFVVLVLVLLLLLQTFLQQIETEQMKLWNNAAEIAVDELSDLDYRSNRSALNTRMDFLRGRYDIVMIRFVTPDGAVLESGYPLIGGRPGEGSIVRQESFGRLTFQFDPTASQARRRTFLLTAGISVSATILGTILLLLYIPRITRPLEELLDHARSLGEMEADMDESNYLIQTFKNSIDTLKSQEVELKRLHLMERTRAEDIHRLTATLTRSLTSGLIVTGRNRRIAEINQAARETLGLDAERDLSGLSIHEVIGTTPFADRLQSSIEGESTLTRIEEQHLVHGRSLAIGLSTVSLRDEHNTYLGTMALFTDLTPIRTLERRVNDMKILADLGEISAGIAHEFRNSLSTIQGYIRLARLASTPEEIENKLRCVEDEARQLLQAVQGLLNFAQPMPLDRNRVELMQLMTSVMDALRPSFPAIVFHLSGSEVKIDGDSALLRRAFENVLRNAADSIQQKGPDGGRIDVTVQASSNPRIVVEDDGVGVDAADVQRFFLPFQTGKPGGFGLGLPLSKKIILLHNGTITMQGTVGSGARVIIEFSTQPEFMKAASLPVT